MWFSFCFKDPGSPLRTLNGVLISISCLATFVTMVTILLYKKRKAYTPIGNCPRNMTKGKGRSVFFSHAKAPFFRGDPEKDPLLQGKPGTL